VKPEKPVTNSERTRRPQYRSAVFVRVPVPMGERNKRQSVCLSAFEQTLRSIACEAFTRVRMPRTSSVAPPPSSEFRADNPPFLDRSNSGANECFCRFECFEIAVSC